MTYEFDIARKDFFNDELCKFCTDVYEEQIAISSIALEMLKKWSAYRQSGNDIHQENLFSIGELADFFYIQIDRQDEFKNILEKAHKYFQKNKERHGYEPLSYKIGRTVYFSVPKLINIWPLMEKLIVLSIFYREGTHTHG